jgi:soluble lytic murein transglycosylase-like protein
MCAIPAHAQIVSYMDTSGKRVFINADPPRAVAPSQKAASTPSGFTKIGLRSTQNRAYVSPELSAAGLANRAKIEEMIREVSARYRVDPALVRAVIETESNWNSAAISRRGALGLMQLVPGTAQQMGVDNALDPKQNIDGGVRYLHGLLERYNGDLDKVLAAYNAGPGAVDRAGGVPRYRETREYVQKVTDSYFRPGSDRLPRAFESRQAIYRAVEADGRVVFTNE